MIGRYGVRECLCLGGGEIERQRRRDGERYTYIRRGGGEREEYLLH